MQESIDYINGKILNINDKIERNIHDSGNDRGYMAQNMLKSFRDLTEFIAFKVYILECSQKKEDYTQESIRASIKYIKSERRHQVLTDFHSLLQLGPSHTTYTEDGSIRLMVKYQESLIELREYYFNLFSENILNNLSEFPVDKMDPVLISYYGEIYNALVDVDLAKDEIKSEIYYVVKTKPIIFKDKIFYELTLSIASDYINKFNRLVFYSPFKIPNNYAIKLNFVEKNVKYFEGNTLIKIINNYRIFIRPCEFNNLYKLFGQSKRVSFRSNEYDAFMRYLKENNCTINDIVNLNQESFDKLEFGFSIYNTHSIIELIKLIRSVVCNNLPGTNILKYLIFVLRNNVLKDQISSSPCSILSDLYLYSGCKVFDDMPFASSPIKHKVSIYDLIKIIDVSDREHELFAKKVNDICNDTNRIYVSLKELGCSLEEAKRMCTVFNDKVYYKHVERKLKIRDNNYVYVDGFEKSTISILNSLITLSKFGYNNYIEKYVDFILGNEYEFSDDNKEKFSEILFKDSSVAFIYGSAGTGKTEMIKIIGMILKKDKIAFLTKTNSALNNLRNRLKEVNQSNFSYFTIDTFINNKKNEKYDLIIIDECSMVENTLMKKLLDVAQYDAIMLVGDIYQIESIDFGNWFRFAKEFIPQVSYELLENFRTSNNGLINLWKRVRTLNVGISEGIIDKEYSELLSDSIFDNQLEDEIILCLNYDGPYGINNINKFMQEQNPNEAFIWGINMYKVGDPIIFSNTGRFSKVLYNSLKGKILNIEKTDTSITFQICVEKTISTFESFFEQFDIISSDASSTTVEFSVSLKTDDDLDDSVQNIVPFVVSYATSIHKAQGLEFDSVKIVITEEYDELITKGIFYTAITRSKNHLKIYWTPECQNNVIKNLQDCNLTNDINIIKSFSRK